MMQGLNLVKIFVDLNFLEIKTRANFMLYNLILLISGLGILKAMILLIKS